MLRRLRSDQRGLAAVEFALIAPMMILLYTGLAEFTLAMMAERRAAHAASVVADLVAQTNQITVAQVSDVFTVANAIMSPFSTTTLKLRITSVTADVNGVPKVSWSQGSGLGALTTGATVAGFPPTLLAAGDSVIMADVQYAFTSPLKLNLPNPINYSDTFYLRPRTSPSVTLLP
ncbi:MAG TPA: TadE/TadG family type IV pilus assembly protein [Phenylobacterium sp.]|jgi:Flp pilus assembly protein TadG|uniref:TadE/TadG family type IV pilus assembly protein n=1 Tax=Phenylobacterium sp. TaxID=1871053 RepID=UPI002C8CCC86|nr:TadE/TadG family type IV pilus assembly protein [Phenylobacterium sp.]HXA39155.1 TadE/TadG family type IV pilus assembly protein [Phenylobacterium sp.]